MLKDKANFNFTSSSSDSQKLIVWPNTIKKLDVLMKHMRDDTC